MSTFRFEKESVRGRGLSINKFWWQVEDNDGSLLVFKQFSRILYFAVPSFLKGKKQSWSSGYAMSSESAWMSWTSILIGALPQTTMTCHVFICKISAESRHLAQISSNWASIWRCVLALSVMHHVSGHCFWKNCLFSARSYLSFAMSHFILWSSRCLHNWFF